jgi:hypothetical protein
LTAEAVEVAAKRVVGFKQRWDRNAYNEYQRKLMRERRAKEREKRRGAARSGFVG